MTLVADASVESSVAVVGLLRDTLGVGFDCSVAELKELPADEIDAQVKFYKEAVTFEDKKFEELLKGLQAQYEEAKKAADKEKAAHKRKIKVLKALAKAKAPDAEL